jgi:hypothetical protein
MFSESNISLFFLKSRFDILPGSFHDDVEEEETGEIEMDNLASSCIPGCSEGNHRVVGKANTALLCEEGNVRIASPGRQFSSIEDRVGAANNAIAIISPESSGIKTGRYTVSSLERKAEMKRMSPFLK